MGEKGGKPGHSGRTSEKHLLVQGKWMVKGGNTRKEQGLPNKGATDPLGYEMQRVAG